MKKILIILAAILFMLPVSAFCAKDVAVLSSYDGDVQVRLNDEDSWGEAITGMLLQEEDSIKTGVDGKAKIVLSDESVITVGALSVFLIKSVSEDYETGDRNVLFNLEQGTVRARVTKLQTSTSSFEIQTPTAVAGVRGTDFVVEMNPKNDEAIVTVLEGQVEVGARIGVIKEKILLMKEETSSVKNGRKPEAPRKADTDKLQGFREKLSSRGVSGEMKDDQAAAVVAVHGSRMPDGQKKQTAEEIKSGEVDPGQVKEVLGMGERAGVDGKDLGRAVNILGDKNIDDKDLKALGEKMKSDPGNVNFSVEMDKLGAKGTPPDPGKRPAGANEGPAGDQGMRPPMQDRLDDMKEGPMMPGPKQPGDGAKDPVTNENVIFQKALDMGMPVDKVENLKAAVRDGRMMIREVEMIVSAIRNGVEPKFLEEVYRAMLDFKLEPRVREMVTSALSLGLSRDKLKQYLDGFRDQKLTMDQLREHLDTYIREHVNVTTPPQDTGSVGGSTPPPTGGGTGGGTPPPTTLPKRRSSIGSR